VNQVMGDGIMALFGAPLAHEDHAVRACYAALRMQESVAQYAEGVFRSQGVPIQIAWGSTPARWSSAPSGRICTWTTRRSVRRPPCGPHGTACAARDRAADRRDRAAREGYVEVRTLGPIPVKGLADPIEIFELTGAGTARTRLQAAVLRGLTRFVGRDAEVEHLRRSSTRPGPAGAGGRHRGRGGVGKSRLTTSSPTPIGCRTG
jgi:hypothetical protein